MKAVIQRVKGAKIFEEERLITEINSGLLVLVGIAKGDGKEDADFLARKIKEIRIFSDKNKKMNLSLEDVDGEVLLVSQFTLLGDAKKGRRPDFTKAESQEKAKEIYDYLVERLKGMNVPTKSGNFGAMIDIHLINSGPVTIILDSR
ncbi:TPA: D-tyrosyl-tRNA(Tyr) deacylase [bacterium]|nr:D-tyrosyl-tRNA(Tyr) deacylase [bacterium]